jgi:epoxyqueuosine reductase
VSDTTGHVFRGTPEAEAARRAHEATVAPPAPPPLLEADWLRQLCLDAGAADVGFVEVGRPALGAETDNARRVFPAVSTLISLVGVSNREAIRSTSRATANGAWHHTGATLEHAAATICARLAESGVRSIGTNLGFPMDLQPAPGQVTWSIAHKTVAVEAGMGHMGVNRNVIHPQFGNFILLETIMIDAPVSAYDEPLDYNPCLGCNLCVTACPVGAVQKDGEFDFFACLGHNYREFPFSATDWVAALTAKGGSAAYRAKFNDGETLSMLQALLFEPSYKSAYCMAVCPAGEDVIGNYLTDKAAYRNDVVVPLLRHPEPVYVRSGSRAEKVARRNPSKRVRYLDFDPDVSTPSNFAVGLRHLFQSAKADELTATIAFELPDGTVTATVDHGTITTGEVEDHQAEATVVLTDEDYVRLLHPPSVGRPPASFTVDGDSSLVDRFLACLV